MASADCADFN